MKTSFYSIEELAKLGLKKYGENVLISRLTQIYSPANLSVGDNVRIDDFCILSGDITIGSNVHISAYCALHGSKGIIMEDNTGCSARTTIYSAIDDFSGEFLVGPMHNSNQTHVTGGPVHIEKFSQIGAHCVVFPNITIAEGCAIGAMSLVKRSTTPWKIYAGIPASFIKNRSNKMLTLL